MSLPLACTLVVAPASCAHRDTASDPDFAPSVKLETARFGSMVRRIAVFGHVGPPARSNASLAFAEPGVLKTVGVHVGERVSAGDTLAELDRRVLAAPLAQAEGDARAAEAAYGGGAVAGAAVAGAAQKLAASKRRLAQLQSGGPTAQAPRITAGAAVRQVVTRVALDRDALARTESLLSAGVVARKDVAAARAQLTTDLADEGVARARARAAPNDAANALAQAKADVASAESDLDGARAQAGVLAGQSASAGARLTAAQLSYANGVLIAPADGVVLAILKHPGENVDVTTPVIELGPSSAHSLTFDVPGEAAALVAVGDLVDVRSSQTSVAGGRGRVLAVVPAIDPATQQATIVASGAPAGSLPGEAVAGSIAVGTVRGVIVPTSAIVEDPQTGRNVVFVRVEHPKDGDSAFAMRTVTIRASDEDRTALASGLHAGEHFAASGGYALLAPTGGGG